MGVSEKLKTLIIKTVVKDAVYDTSMNRVIPLYKVLHADEEDLLRSAIMEEGHNPNDLGTIINDTLNSAGTFPKVQREYKVQPDELPLGQHIRLKTLSSQFGSADIELMCIDVNRFLVLSCETRSLQLGDILESVTMPWNAEYKANFKVKRNGIPFPDKNHLFETYPLVSIDLLNPPDIYEYLDKEDDTSESENGNIDKVTYYEDIKETDSIIP